MQLAELDVLARNAEFAETRRMTIRISGGIRAVFDSCTNADERDRLGRGARFTIVGFRLSPPEQTETFAVPAQKRVRLHDEHGAGPPRRAACEHDQDDAIPRTQTSPANLAA